MSIDWCGLTWTPWAPLDREGVRGSASGLPGIYRVRREGGDHPGLVYIGQTGRTLRERLLSLSSGVNGDQCPFNDPHTAAPHLWLMRTLDGIRLEFSCAPVVGDTQALHGTEDMLLWRHRVEAGHSTEANYGRFYPRYVRPTNRSVRRGGPGGTSSPGRRAAPLIEGIVATDFAITRPALQGDGGPLQAPWWHRAPLDREVRLPSGPAVYCVHDRAAAEPTYVGETSGLPARAMTHATRQWQLHEPQIAYMPLPARTPKHVLRELESDLLGWHFWLTGRAPAAQYRKADEVTSDTGEPKAE